MMSMGKILVVDDDYNICELLRLYIEKEGYDVVIANDGGQAITKFKMEKPDLILLDIMLPVLDGWQVCREIRKTSQCPIIMLTAKGEVFDKVLGLELGADDYVIKPFETKEIVARIKAVLRRAGINTSANVSMTDSSRKEGIPPPDMEYLQEVRVFPGLSTYFPPAETLPGKGFIPLFHSFHRLYYCYDIYYYSNIYIYCIETRLN